MYWEYHGERLMAGSAVNSGLHDIRAAYPPLPPPLPPSPPLPPKAFGAFSSVFSGVLSILLDFLGSFKLSQAFSNFGLQTLPEGSQNFLELGHPRDPRDPLEQSLEAP